MKRQGCARLIGIGSYLPEKVLTNLDLEKIVDTSDEWILSRTGMKERRIASDHEASSDMAVAAAINAISDAGINAGLIDLVIVATSTPDYLMPSTAALVQARIGAAQAAAFDLQAACTGYLYALATAKAYVESGMASHVLCIAVDKMSAFVDYQDRATCVLFGDGASAAVVSCQGAGFLIDSIQLGSDGELFELIMIPGGGSRHPATSETLLQKKHFFRMEGKEVFKHAVRKMESAAKKCLDLAGLTHQQISWLVPHQANERIIDALAKKFQIPLEKVGKTVHKYGNTSASSMAITLDELRKEQEIKNGDHLLLVAFGAGLTWGASILTKCEDPS